MAKKRKSNVALVNIEDLRTWRKYKQGMCDDCVANCCRMPVEAKLSDLIRMGVVDAFEAEEQPKKIAKRLKKEGLIEHFNGKREVFTLARRANSDCMYLHPTTRRCTIYNVRPDICREHPQVGPRPGFCAYEKRA